MQVAIFSTKSYDRQFFTAANAQHQHQLTFLEPKLDRPNCFPSQILLRSTVH